MQTVSTLVLWQVAYPVLCSIGFAEPSKLKQVRTTCFFLLFTENRIYLTTYKLIFNKKLWKKY